MSSIKPVKPSSYSGVFLFMSEDGRIIKERLESIIKFKGNKKEMVIFSLLVAFMIFCVSALFGSYWMQRFPIKDHSKYKVEETYDNGFHSIYDVDWLEWNYEPDQRTQQLQEEMDVLQQKMNELGQEMTELGQEMNELGQEMYQNMPESYWYY